MKKKGIKGMTMNEKDQPTRPLDSLTEQEILTNREREKIRDEKSRDPQSGKENPKSGAAEETTE